MSGAKRNPENVHETYLLARKLYEKENFDEAEKLLETLAAEAPFFADVFNKLGVIYHQRGAFGRAAKAFEKALELNPRYTEAALNLAVTYNNLGRYEHASAAFRSAAGFSQAGPGALDPFIRGKLANQHADLGDIYFDLGLHGEAVTEYRKAVELGPKFADLRTKLAVALRERGDFESALQEFQEALKVNAKYVPAYLHLGMTYYMRGLVDRAERVWKTALKASPGDKSVQVYLEFLKERRKR
ncbi:MAG TPA: tetratricopeptide repeat protein [Candidatus Methanoperedens sp.]|nr:tetratricopeptide repeat protein [Candidatus Methanoperedens sp.]